MSLLLQPGAPILAHSWTERSGRPVLDIGQRSAGQSHPPSSAPAPARHVNSGPGASWRTRVQLVNAGLNRMAPGAVMKGDLSTCCHVAGWFAATWPTVVRATASLRRNISCADHSWLLQ